MDIIKYLGLKPKREKIIERLLNDGHISASEAMQLLKVKERVTIRIDSLSSGARVVVGEDNSVESR